ncbi:serine hydrolase domain-containing protein [Nocardia sp. 004]|uniref:serine hydrolase domain-containing protein n=1 Tax=Nocardia sp. 004 TaxID=3385978 RepID=UPI0039A1F181
MARYAVKLAESPLIAEPGARASYSQAGFNLAGRIIENVTGTTFEQAVTSLLSEPLGLAHSRYAVNDVITRRFAVGHNTDTNGVLAVARQWKDNRADNPGGGVVTSASDLLRWARFHLGDGRIETGERILPTELLHRMREQTVELHGSTLGDAFGICWFPRTVDGVATITLGLLPGDTDEYIVTAGGLQGQRGFFARDESGAVTGIDLAGRLLALVR